MPPDDPWDELRERVSAEIERSRTTGTYRADPGSPHCHECERPIGDSGRWYRDSVSGQLLAYCKACSETHLPVL
jgi:hypothetical protein